MASRARLDEASGSSQVRAGECGGGRGRHGRGGAVGGHAPSHRGDRASICWPRTQTLQVSDEGVGAESEEPVLPRATHVCVVLSYRPREDDDKLLLRAVRRAVVPEQEVLGQARELPGHAFRRVFKCECGGYRLPFVVWWPGLSATLRKLCEVR